MTSPTRTSEVDAVVIGAGFSGIYMLKRLRDNLGMTARVFEAGNDVGGTWYWNRYPGARCDSEAYMYCFSFDKDLMQEWNWSGKYPEQPEILKYLQHVTDRFDLRSQIEFNTRVTAAHFNESNNRWLVETDQGDRISAQFLITGIGCISSGQIPDIPGRDSFVGESYHTGSWPHEGVNFTGKRVGVIGTGSSGVQSIPVIAEQAKHLTVFQRTPQYMVPARHHTVDREYLDDVKANYDEIWETARHSKSGFPYEMTDKSALSATADERTIAYEKGWEEGGFKFIAETFPDISVDLRANATASEFIRSKIREVVDNPDTAEKLLPRDHPFTSKRPLIDTNYYETYNRDNVELVDIRNEPIDKITSTGIRTEDGDYPLDIIVFATGFDAMTGSFFKMDIRGRNSLPLKEKWAAGPKTYLGLSTTGFPNMFMITGPGSPSVLSNMPVSIEQHVEFISDMLESMRERGFDVAEPNPQAEEDWVEHVNEVAEKTLYVLADSWYLGANIPGKPRVFMPYSGGVGDYRAKCEEIAAAGYEGYVLSTST
tara:strand:- start:2038 stop:3660 length:1623 start_codon:yes stop_codon:yes gene_type:complete